MKRRPVIEMKGFDQGDAALDRLSPDVRRNVIVSAGTLYRNSADVEVALRCPS